MCVCLCVYVSEPTMYTVQVGENIHIDCFDGARFTNHHCKPTAYISYEGDIGLKALRDMKEGDEVTFDYNTNEWVYI